MKLKLLTILLLCGTLKADPLIQDNFGFFVTGTAMTAVNYSVINLLNGGKSDSPFTRIKRTNTAVFLGIAESVLFSVLNDPNRRFNPIGALSGSAGSIVGGAGILVLNF